MVSKIRSGGGNTNILLAQSILRRSYNIVNQCIKLYFIGIINMFLIALTADLTTVGIEECKANGMNDYNSKPIDEKLLLNKIVSLVRKYELT